jgi:hypothetical protein
VQCWAPTEDVGTEGEDRWAEQGGMVGYHRGIGGGGDSKGRTPSPCAWPPTENRTGEWRLGSTVDWGKLKYQTKPAARLETSPLSLFWVLSNGFGLWGANSMSGSGE